MSYACNHACLFCSCPWFDERGGFEKKPELTIAQWRQVVERLCAMGVTELCFTGGEPLLKEGLVDLIEFAAGCKTEHVRSVGEQLAVEVKPPHLHLLTNGLAMSEAVLALCKKHQIHIGMSLPGLTTFREHTRASEPSGVLRWFRRAKEEGVNTHVGITVTRQNLHELYETMAEALLAGAGEVLLNRFLPGGRGLSHAKELMLEADQVRQMLATAEEVLRLAGRFGNVGTELPKCIFDPKAHTHLTVGSSCAAALDFFAIDPGGWVRACNHSPERLAPFSQIESVKDHPTWRRFISRDYQPKECGSCVLAAGCAGGCREAARIWNGSLDSLDPIFDRCPPRPVER
jgi:radical SAM protein with 4Fe4S-binding SPASM domain